MASIQTAIDMCTKLLRASPQAFPILWGKPGSGKSDGAYQIGEALGLEPGRILRVHVNNHDVVDMTGVPSVTEGQTVFNPTKMFYQFREGTGPGMIILEELPQTTNHMQTWAAGFVLERETPTFRLDPAVRIIATGNRVEDKAGARQLLSHLNDRAYHVDIEDSLDDWCAWSIANGVDPLGVAFLRLRPGLLNDFDPARRSNPTQRSWTKLFTEVPADLPTHQYLELAQGKVGEGAAAEWVAARDMMHKMPSIDTIRMQPEKTEVPEEPAVRYAVATAMSMTADEKSFDRDMLYITRMPKEFEMVYVSDVLRAHPKVQQSRAFIDWAVKNQDIFMNSN